MPPASVVLMLAKEAVNFMRLALSPKSPAKRREVLLFEQLEGLPGLGQAGGDGEDLLEGLDR